MPEGFEQGGGRSPEKDAEYRKIKESFSRVLLVQMSFRRIATILIRVEIYKKRKIGLDIGLTPLKQIPQKWKR